jgi:putative ABC transport system substrate-binding protein
VIDRRKFVLDAVIGLCASPLMVQAQDTAKRRRIAFLALRDAPYTMEWETPLRQLGWIEGKNIIIERRFIGERRQLPRAVEDLIRLEVELIITDGTDAALAAKRGTTTIPIVMAAVGDPVGMGIVASLANPGGNITGYSMVSTEIAAKRAALVHELLPAVRRIALVGDRESAIGQRLRRESEAAYRSLGVTPVAVDADTLQELQENLAPRAVQAVELAFDAPTPERAAEAITAMMRLRLPAIVGGKLLLEAGDLMALFNDADDQGGRVAAMIDKILRGARPADIPIEQPTKFVFLINLKAAKALDITVPQSMLLRADEVIR